MLAVSVLKPAAETIHLLDEVKSINIAIAVKRSGGAVTVGSGCRLRQVRQADRFAHAGASCRNFLPEATCL